MQVQVQYDLPGLFYDNMDAAIRQIRLPSFAKWTVCSKHIFSNGDGARFFIQEEGT